MSQKSIRSFFKPIKENSITSDEPLEAIIPNKEKNDFLYSNGNDRENKIRSREQGNKINLEKHISNLDTTDNQKAASYDPSSEDYHPLNDAYWRVKAVTPYQALTRTFQIIEETKGRLKMIDILSNFFCSVMLVSPQDIVPCVYLSINQLAPAYEGLELGVAETTLMKAICRATGRDMNHIKTQSQTIGDLGIVAEQSRISQRMMFRPAPLTVSEVYKKLKHIAQISGQSKINFVYDAFVACQGSEARFFIRSLIGKLRIGIAEQSLLQSLAVALVKRNHFSRIGTNKLNVKHKEDIDDTALILKTAFCQCPNYDILLPVFINCDIKELLEKCPMRPGMPLKPMLAQPSRGVQEVLDRFNGMHITCEFKYDGERAQIHCNENGDISIYSRNQENNTFKYPDVIERIKTFAKDSVTSYIIDSEIVAWDVEKKQILPFQMLTTRKRKNVLINEIKVQVCVYVFDLLYLNGVSLVTIPLSERRKALFTNFQEVEGHWKYVTFLDTDEIDDVQQFLEESIKGSCEGLMIKALHKDSNYEIARRSRNWLKLKKDYLSNVGDSLDLVVIGGYQGKGKRTGTYGGFLLACYDSENEEYQSICKIGTGFTDEDLRKHSDYFKNYIIAKPKSYFRYDNLLEPDHWFEPVQVWEIKCADLSLSPIHRAAIGIVDNERGISLRFPRFVRLREDKSVENATDAHQVAEMYQSQDQIKNNSNKKGMPMDIANEFY